MSASMNGWPLRFEQEEVDYKDAMHGEVTVTSIMVSRACDAFFRRRGMSAEGFRQKMRAEIDDRKQRAARRRAASETSASGAE